MPNALPQRILLVDDDPALLELLRLSLAEYELASVPDAESALTMAEAFDPDLFILDLVLPGMRGTSLALVLRDMPAFRETPIIFVSGLVEGAGADGEPVRLLGFTAFPKPFKVDVLQRHVHLQLTDPAGAQEVLQQLRPGKVAGD